MTPPVALLRADALVKQYTSGADTLTVLNGVTGAFAARSIVTIAGASGAGKSTLLHILAGLDRPSRGSVFFDSQDLYSMPDAARARVRNAAFGFVFQFYHLMPEMTALENVLLPSMVARQVSRAAREHARGLLDAVGLAARAAHYPNQLSGGEQQRVAIARALMNQPRIVFADEPTGNLDKANSTAVFRVLLDVQQQWDFALILVTHDPDLAACGHVRWRLADGTLQPAAAVDAVIHAHPELS
ncbi:MAG: ABC transporter ATP-binding protein [bacterium]|nr:ABC transporter ATP-binding protein [bacterium]